MSRTMTGAVIMRIRSYTEGEFYRYAAVEAVDAALDDAEGAASVVQRHIAWLRDVKQSRINETARRAA